MRGFRGARPIWSRSAQADIRAWISAAHQMTAQISTSYNTRAAVMASEGWHKDNNHSSDCYCI